MEVSIETLAALRLRLRLAGDDFDQEISELASAALASLGAAGVPSGRLEACAASPKGDAMVMQAVTCYVKAGFGLDNEDAARYSQAYGAIRAALAMQCGANETAGGRP